MRSIKLAVSKLLKNKAGALKPPEFSFLGEGDGGLLPELTERHKVVKHVEKEQAQAELPASKLEKLTERGKVLDSYGQVEIMSVEGQDLPIYRIKMPENTKE